MKRMIVLATLLAAFPGVAIAEDAFFFRHSGLLPLQASSTPVEEGAGGEEEPSAWISLSDTVLQGAVVGEAWEFDFASLLDSSGVVEADIQWSFGEQGGPDGLSFFEAGLVSGYPISTGSHSFEVVASHEDAEGRREFLLEVNPASVWIDVASVTQSHSSCGLKADGTAWCWGSNDQGLLGIGNASPSFSRSPLQVAGSARFVRIHGGARHFCGLEENGQAWCWGVGIDGQLGQGDTQTRGAPSMVSGHVFDSIALGRNHSCGLDAAGSAWCWGTGYNAQPTLVAEHTFTQVTGGNGYTCGIKSDHSAWCWGLNNDSGQLGTNAPASMSPTLVAGGHAFTSLAGGWSVTCGVRVDGAGMCWGTATSARLGTGDTSGSVSEPKLVLGEMSFSSMAGAGQLANCGIRDDGAGICWGSGSYGRLGTGQTGWGTVPTEMTGGNQFLRIAPSIDHMCGLRADGAIYCWGRNHEGQMGNPSLPPVNQLVPGPIADPI